MSKQSKLRFHVKYNTNRRLKCDYCDKNLQKEDIVIARVWESSKLAKIWKHLDCIGQKISKNNNSVDLEGLDLLNKKDQQLVQSRIKLFIKNEGKNLTPKELIKLNLNQSKEKSNRNRKATSPNVPEKRQTRAMEREEKRKGGQSVDSPVKNYKEVSYKAMKEAYANQQKKNKVIYKKVRPLIRKSRSPSRSKSVRGRDRKRNKSQKNRSYSNHKSQTKSKSRSISADVRSRRSSEKSKVKKIEKKSIKNVKKSKSTGSRVSTSPAKSQKKQKKRTIKKKKKDEQSDIEGPTKAQRNEYQTLLAKYYNETKQSLSALLKKNFMKISGSKQELCQRIASAIMFGYIRLCPSCGGGKPNFFIDQLRWKCKGFLDDLDYVNCHKKFKVGSIQTQKFVVQKQ